MLLPLPHLELQIETTNMSAVIKAAENTENAVKMMKTQEDVNVHSAASVFSLDT